MVDLMTQKMGIRPLRPWRLLGWVALVAGLYAFLVIIINLSLGAIGCKVMWGMLQQVCGTNLGLAAAGALIMIPPALYFTMKRPWIFPGALYAFLLPSDSYLNLTSGGSLTKFAAIMVSGGLIFMILRKRAVVKPGAATLVWIAYFLLNSLSLFWLYNPADAVLPWQIYFTLTQLVLSYLVFVISPIDEKEFQVLLYAFIAGSCAASIFGAHVFAQAAANGQLNQGRLKTHFNSDNHIASDIFATSLVMPVGIAVMWVLRAKVLWQKALCVATFACLMIGQYAVASRGAILADIVCIGYFFLRGRYRSQLMFVAACGLIVAVMFPNAIWARFVNPHDTGGSGRLEIWKVGWAAFKGNWLFGTGISTFEYVYNHYFLTVFNAFYTSWNRAPHNIILEVGVELGIGGIIILVLGFFMTYKSLGHIGKNDPLYDLRVMLEGGIIATFFGALFVGIMFEKFTWWDFALVGMARTISLRRAPPAGEIRLAPVSTAEPAPDPNEPVEEPHPLVKRA